MSLVDLHPTILELAGAQNVDAALGHGRSRLAPEPDPDRAIYLDHRYVWFDPDPNADQAVVRRQLQGVRRGAFKLIKRSGKQGAYFFDTSVDPREQQNLARSTRDRVRRKGLEKDLRRWRAEMEAERSGRQRGADAVLDPAEQARLRALGYLD